MKNEIQAGISEKNKGLTQEEIHIKLKEELMQDKEFAPFMEKLKNNTVQNGN